MFAAGRNNHRREEVGNTCCFPARIDNFSEKVVRRAMRAAVWLHGGESGVLIRGNMIFRNIHPRTCRAWLSLVSPRHESCFYSTVPLQPVPPLTQTLQGYLWALEPLLPPEELNHTRRMVQEFGRPGGLGQQLQEGLERRARHTKNW
ncbi:hypothetical protein ATANTOWER_031316, partial [Ataeniobius toweri]|nr:hypothetical protein [Ataeniobius toweri]